MNFTNKDICSLLFTQNTPNKTKCTVCGNVYKQGNGYTNQMHHLLKKYPDYPQLAEAAFRRGNPLGLTMPDQRTNEIFRWIEWCVFDRMPVSFCDYVRDVIAAKLPETFGLVLDGWSSGGRHFIAIMAVYHDPSVSNPGSRKPGYDESIHHRFQLAVNAFLADHEPVLAKIHALMKHLSTIKCRAALRKVTPLAPTMRNATRWSIAKHGIAGFLLTPEETEAARTLLKSLHELNEVSKALQDSTLTLVGAR
ncbi:hypothetical protein PHMEG_00018582 [Phytophthora megakarya]|uniref:BED-type domain-containing protein n=1 Tax=Phytophthora megakarya TaxID=4795 RepID=A0A225VV12_9STRA|nr:hypothetical protein PHMEG_00018582 [Phytophthora megakarya]